MSIQIRMRRGPQITQVGTPLCRLGPGEVHYPAPVLCSRALPTPKAFVLSQGCFSFSSTPLSAPVQDRFVHRVAWDIAGS